MSHDTIHDISSLPERKRPNYKARQAAAGALAVLALLGVKEGIDLTTSAFDKAQTAVEHKKQKTYEDEFFNQEDLAAQLKEKGDVAQSIGFITIQDGDNPIKVAREYGAKDIQEVAGRIANQFGGAGNLQPGAEVALPLDDFDPAAITTTDEAYTFMDSFMNVENKTLFHKNTGHVQHIVPVESQQ